MVVELKTERKLDYEYDPKTKRFRYTKGASKGSFLSRDAAKQITLRGIERTKESIVNLSSELRTGKIDAVQFIDRMTARLTELHIYQATIAAGGSDRLTANVKKIIRNNLKDQFGKGFDPLTEERYGLRYLLADLVKGEVSADQLTNRLRLYSESGKVTYHDIEFEYKKEGGFKWALRILGATDKHCPECLDYSSRGKVRIEDLILPAHECSCKNNCQCTVEYYK